MATGKKTGGRSAGTPNRGTAKVREIARGYCCEALKELHRLSTKAESEQARVAASRLLLERGYGTASPSQPISIELPDISTASGVVQAMNVVAQATASGGLTPAEARDVGSIIETQRRAIETTDLAERMTLLKEAIQAQSGR